MQKRTFSHKQLNVREVRKWVGGHQDTVRGEDLQVQIGLNRTFWFGSSFCSKSIPYTGLDHRVSEQAWSKTSLRLDRLQRQPGQVQLLIFLNNHDLLASGMAATLVAFGVFGTP